MPEPQDELPYISEELDDAQLLERFGLTNGFNKSKIKAYSSNVLDHCQGFLAMPHEPKTNLYFGVEYEICAIDNPDYSVSGLVDDVLSAFNGRAIVCHDGSVSHGFEVITVPATLSFHKNELWHNFFTSNLVHRLAGTAGCGNHVHVSKKAWTPLTVGKLLTFIHSDDNSDFVSSISGRGQSSYCSRHRSLAKPSSILTGSFSRNNAINIGPRDTIEFRMFKTSINPANLFKNLEFIDAIRHFTFNHKIGDMKTEKFLEFIVENHSLWPYLIHYLAKNDWVIVQQNERVAA